MANFEGRYSVVSHVLVIEDDPAIRDWYRDTLTAAKLTVDLAKDGGQAHSSFNMHKPDFVILDLMLPGESGYEVVERFKQVDKSVPVLVVSEVALEESHALAQRCGADEYLVKPLESDELIDAIHRVGEQVWRRHHLGEGTDDSARVRFPCRSCESRIKVKASYAGRRLACPNCGAMNVVPR